MKYVHIENELYVSIPALKDDIKEQFKVISKLEPSEGWDGQLVSLNILYTFLETITAQLAESIEPTTHE